ncbi:mRNA splicing factor [Lichtheimia hyalospora FSU 10163]|nr:mRNA splicing factor [Lichtheimia hyalospora FSU 10163]
MEEEARKRKERLSALRKRKVDGENNAESRLTMRNRTLAFKSYTPNDENLKQHVNIATPDDVGETVESETKNFTKDALAEAAVKEKEEVDLFNLQPKKPNWDLKRDVEKKLERLDRRTQKAVLELIRQRLSNETDKTAHLAEAVANAEKQQQLEKDD